MHTEENIKRRPRPLGLTQKSLEYQKEPTHENLVSLYNFVIHSWLLSNGKFGNQTLDTSSLSKVTGIPIDFIQTYMADQVINSKVWDKDRQKQLVNGLLGQQLAWTLEDRMEINQQVALLKQSQNGHYTPFVSAELGKALGLKINATNSMQSMIRMLMGGGTTNIFNMFAQQNNDNHVENTLTIEQARQIIQESGSILEDNTKEAKLLETRYDIKELPEVVATKQEGHDKDNYGSNFNVNQAELNQITDDYKGALEESDKEHHEMRREIEANIDPDAPDPEIELEEDQMYESNNGSMAQHFLNGSLPDLDSSNVLN